MSSIYSPILKEVNIIDENHHHAMMSLAIKQARKAWQLEEVPVGAVLTSEDGNIIATAFNQTIGLPDPTGHAEIIALRRAAKTANNYRLLNTILYVTVEPCIMCMGALIHARVKRIVFGASDLKWGAAGSLYNFASDSRLNHQIEIIRGIRETECKNMMQAFFQERRKRNNQS